MDTKKFTLVVSVMTAVVCLLTIVYNFASAPAYGDGNVSAQALYQESEASSSQSASGNYSSGDSTVSSSQAVYSSSKTISSTSSSKSTTSKATVSEPVNINTATLEQLESVPYIGPTKAQAIIDYRSAHGKFSSIDGLDNVKGIGSKTIEKIRKYLTI